MPIYFDGYVDDSENYPEDFGAANDHRNISFSEDAGGSYSSFNVPDVVKKYISYFRDTIRDRFHDDIHILYNDFSRLSEQYYKESSWPDLDDLYHTGVLEENQDVMFEILYQELYFRHIYARVPGGPTIEQRMDSYQNYCNFFNVILTAETPVKLDLPNQWLWEIIDEFIYQFQAFSHYRSKLQKKTESELDMLREHPKTWNVHSVLNVLHCVINKSNINEQLKTYTAGGSPEDVAGDFGSHPLYKMLGYFSLIGLLRLHSLLGDYYQALKVLENIELNKKNMYSRIAACQITTYYYVGFAYMMMRRYADATRTFTSILIYIQRSRALFQSKTYQNDQINKQTEQMYSLLSMCLVLHPQRIDEAIQSTLREKNLAEKIGRMARGDINEFSSCFSYASPKFVSPVGPPLDAVAQNYHMEPTNVQLKVFQDEVEQQIQIGIIRSYLKLYKTIPVSKIAHFNGMTPEDFTDSLLCFKHKMMNKVWTKGTSGLSGELQSDSEVDFFIDAEMIHIADTKVDQRYGDFFIRQIHKLEEVGRGLNKVKV